MWHMSKDGRYSMPGSTFLGMVGVLTVMEHMSRDGGGTHCMGHMSRDGGGTHCMGHMSRDGRYSLHGADI